MADAVWTTGFSRHSPPRVGGGANLITWDGAAARNANAQFSRVASCAGARNLGRAARRLAQRASGAVESMTNAPWSRGVA